MRDEAEGVDFQQLPSLKGSRTSKSVRARTEETNLRVKTVKVCGWLGHCRNANECLIGTTDGVVRAYPSAEGTKHPDGMPS